MSHKFKEEAKPSQPPSLKVELLLSILMTNSREDRGRISSDPEEPLIVSEAMIQKLEEDRNLLQRLMGWKGETLWTTKAVQYLLKHQKP